MLMKGLSWSMAAAALAVGLGLSVADAVAAQPTPIVRKARFSGATPGKLSDMRFPDAYAGPTFFTRENPNPSPWSPQYTRNKTIRKTGQPFLAGKAGDGALQSQHPGVNTMAGPLYTFEGLNNADSAGVNGGGYYVPPDTVGDVGPAHYVQAVNTAMRIFTRDGTPLTPPFLISHLFASLGSGSKCATTDDGDPIVLYDHLADRWLVSQFSVTDPAPYSQCIAISQTGDPTGAWYVYDFVMPNDKMNDYPHFGVWPTAYFMTDNQFTANWAGAGVFAFDRARLLAGDPSASYIYFDLESVDVNIGGMLPADLDGPPPPSGSPGLFAYFTATEYGDSTDGLRLFAFTPDFATPASSSFTELTAAPLAVAAFDPVSPNSRGQVPQPSPATSSNKLDAITDRLMHRLQYRNFGAYESLVVMHTVDASGDSSAAVFKAGVRYYQLTRSASGSPWTVNEQATFAPDAAHRFMGSAAMDGAGNLAVAYSVSSDTLGIFPSLRYAGRLASDAANGLAQGEQTLYAGTGVQTTTSTAQRWGDYASLSVDPVDDCKFWFTSEYYANPLPAACTSLGNSSINARCWQTRIGNFQFPGCSVPAKGTLTGQVTLSGSSAPLAGVLVAAGNGYLAMTDASGHYTLRLPPGSYDMGAARVGLVPGTATGVAVTSLGTATRDFTLSGVPTLQATTATLDDSVTPYGNDNGIVDANECLAVDLGVGNAGYAAATGYTATLASLTPGVTVRGAASASGLTFPVYGTSTQRFEIGTPPSLQAGTPIQLQLSLNGAAGNFTLPYTLATGSPSATGLPFSATGPVSIPDNSTTGAMLSIPVSGVTGAVSKVKVALYLTHTWISDLTISLIAPDNTEVMLASGVGASGDNMGQNCPTTDGNDTIFDDAAGTPIGSGTAPFLGTFKPASPLSGFNGHAPNGTWKLKAFDSVSSDTGTLQCVTLTINGYTTTAGVCDDVIFVGRFD